MAAGVEPLVTLTDAPDPKAAAAIAEGLGRYNDEQGGIGDSRPLAVIIFFLPSSLRGVGLGSRVLRLAEDEGAACS